MSPPATSVPGTGTSGADMMSFDPMGPGGWLEGEASAQQAAGSASEEGRASYRDLPANCACSVEPSSASVELSPPETACATRSNQPAPTSRWCRVAV